MRQCALLQDAATCGVSHFHPKLKGDGRFDRARLCDLYLIVRATLDIGSSAFSYTYTDSQIAVHWKGLSKVVISSPTAVIRGTSN